MVTAEPLTLDDIDITTTERYVEHGYPWREWDLLRREAPVYWYERAGLEPFWAITKHADIQWISKNPDLFTNTQRLRLSDVTAHGLARSREREFVRHQDEPSDLVYMDPPEHREYRAIVGNRFTPRAMRVLEEHFHEMSRDFVGTFAQELADALPRGESCDIVHDLTAKLPVAAICEMAAIPREDWDTIFRWTEILLGSNDPEFVGDEPPGVVAQRTVDEWDVYTREQMARRRAEGMTGNDLLTTLMKAEFEGKPLDPREIQQYMILLLAAGNETTRNATTGGIHALLTYPDQLERLLADRSLLKPAAEEILRWTSVIIQFARTATEDVELRGKTIRKGETVGMWYPSANRDEEVFENPYVFDIAREPNDHFAFGGYGEHFCLGANLARWELRTMLEALLPLLPRMELAGEPERLAGNLHVGGIKRLPVRLSA